MERETESSIKNPDMSIAHVGAAYWSIKDKISPRLALMEADNTLLTSYALSPQHHKTTRSLEDQACQEHEAKSPVQVMLICRISVLRSECKRSEVQLVDCQTDQRIHRQLWNKQIIAQSAIICKFNLIDTASIQRKGFPYQMSITN